MDAFSLWLLKLQVGRCPLCGDFLLHAARRCWCGWTQRVKTAIAAMADDAWTTIEYTDAIFDEVTGRWISDFNAEANRTAGQNALFDTWRFHALFTTADWAGAGRSGTIRLTPLEQSVQIRVGELQVLTQ